MKWVCVLGGSAIQASLITEFVSRGYRVVVADKDPLCYATRLEGAEVYAADTRKPEGIIHLLKTLIPLYGEGPSGVATAGTDVGPSVSLVAEAFHLRACPPQVAITVKDKLYMRETLALPHPWFDSGGPLAYPCVEKPRFESGSRGVRVLEGPPFEWKPDYLWEELLSPQEIVSTDWMVVDGYPIYVNGALRWFSPDTFGLEGGYYNPFLNEPPIQDIAELATSKLGVSDGPFKMDLIKDSRYGWTLLECATRWSGSFDHSVAARYATGRNLSSPLVDYALGLPFNTEYAMSHATVNRHIAVLTPEFKTEYSIPMDAERELLASPGIVDVKVTRWSGTPTLTLADRPLFIFGEGATREEARSHVEEAWRGYREYTRTLNLGGGPS